MGVTFCYCFRTVTDLVSNKCLQVIRHRNLQSRLKLKQGKSTGSVSVCG